MASLEGALTRLSTSHDDFFSLFFSVQQFPDLPSLPFFFLFFFFSDSTSFLFLGAWMLANILERQTRNPVTASMETKLTTTVDKTELFTA